MKNGLLALLICAAFYSSSALAAVNINKASVAELKMLPNISAVKARAIVADREQNGIYTSVDDLTRIHGISASTVDSLRDEAKVR